MSESVAQVYSRAYFELISSSKDLGDADLKDKIKSTYEEFKEVYDLFDRSGYITFLSSPVVDKADKISNLDKIFEQTSDKDKSFLHPFLGVLVQKSRISNLREIFEEFEKLYFEYANIEVARVVSAFKLDDNEKEEILKALSKQTGKQIVIKTFENPDLLAGVQIRIGDLLIDGSVKEKLRGLKQNLNLVRPKGEMYEN